MKDYFFPVLLIFLFIIVFTDIMLAADSPDLVWLIIDQLGIEELRSARTPNLNYLQQVGAFSLMNVRTAGHLQPESTYLSAGAGKRSQGSKFSHTGKNLNSGVINDRIDELVTLNQKTDYHSHPGRLGRLARENDIKIAVLGNSDTASGKRRTIVSMLMDEEGIIPLGDVSHNLLQKIDKPWGVESDLEKLKSKYLEFNRTADAIVIETGDLSRIEEYSDLLTADQLFSEKVKALERMDQFVEFIIKSIELDRTQLGIIVPTPSSQSIKAGKKLSWVLLAGREYDQGWLTSLSTRRRGIITISDLLPTFLQTSGINAGGPPIYTWEDTHKTENVKTNWNDLQKMNNKITLISNLRPFFIKIFIGLQLFLIIMAVLSRALRNRDVNKGYLIIIQGMVEYLLMSLYLIPVNYLVISLLPLSQGWMLLLALVSLTIIMVFLLTRLIEPRLNAIIIITWVLYLLITIDLFLDNTIMADSLLGYSSIIGARYYGLGNEYMGLFLGCGLVGSTGLIELILRKRPDFQKLAKYLLTLFFGLTIYFIGAAQLGANFGGTITAIFVFSITWFKIMKKNFKKGNILLIVFFAATVLTGIIYLDYNEVFGPSSHIGRAIEPVLKGDWQQIFLIIYRKLSMNLKLLRWTIWTRVLLAFIFYLFFLFRYPVPSLKKTLREKPYLAAAFTGGLAGSIITMLVNDSGVVAAATILFYPVLILLDLISSYRYN